MLEELLNALLVEEVAAAKLDDWVTTKLARVADSAQLVSIVARSFRLDSLGAVLFP